MIFNSVEFALFFPVVFLLYWLVFNKKVQLRNLFIIATSYFFYGIWDWRFLILIVISSLSDYILGIQIEKTDAPKKKKLFLATSVIINLGILGFFKYFNFFADSFVSAFTLFGQNISYSSLSIILPVGISFYTFQTMSYTFDIYRNKLKATNDPFAFFAFVSFFPQLVAGPIERAKDLLPQFYTLKEPDYNTIKNGLIMIAIGLFQKIVIADRLAIYVDQTFENIEKASGLPMLLGLVFFAFQLYLDFSAYSKIAIGTASTLGFNLSENFRRPYFASSFSDFWSRWHISLSSWFRDYLYIPLGGNREGAFKTARNILIVFVLSGLWHGASWNFVIWGGLNGLFLILLDKPLSKLNIRGLNTFIVVGLWILSLLFFRARSFDESILGLTNIGLSNIDNLYGFGLAAIEFKLTIWLLLGLLLTEFFAEKEFNLSSWVATKPIVIRYAFYLLLISSILILGVYGIGNDSQFIYFQF